MVKQVLIVAGPTAGGKSSAALNVAQEFNGVVINADSIQVYRELHILSARPSLEDEASAPHSLYGFLSASERFSAGRWLAVAVPEIKSVWEKRKLPIVTGGTGLYLKSLLDGLSPIPDIPEGFRLESEELFSKLGGEAFKEKLRILDPELGASLPAGDGQRLIRAYEVASATGKSLSYWRKIPGAKPLGNAEFKSIILMPPREELYTKIDTRFDLMLGGGALDEAEAIYNLSLDPGLPAMKAVGVPQLGRYLRGEQTIEAACKDAKQASRNLAKRQMTWFRNKIKPNLGIFEQYSESSRDKIFSFIRKLC